VTDSHSLVYSATNYIYRANNTTSDAGSQWPTDTRSQVQTALHLLPSSVVESASQYDFPILWTGNFPTQIKY